MTNKELIDIIKQYISLDNKLRIFFEGVKEPIYFNGIDYHENEFLINDYWNPIDEIKDVKIILRPLSLLTEEIKHNGKRFVPMFELLKMQGFSVGNISDWKFSYHDEFQIIVKATNGNWMLRYMHDQECFFLDGLKDWNKKHQKSRRQFKMYQKLLEWKFDVFGLIEEGYAISTEDESLKGLKIY